MPDPDYAMNRVILEGDIPSPINPPSRCKCRTRCEYAMDICAEVVPQFNEYIEKHEVACHLYPQFSSK